MPLSCVKDFVKDSSGGKIGGCNMYQIDIYNSVLVGTVVILFLIVICYCIWEPCIDREIDSCINRSDHTSRHHLDLLASPGMLKTFS